MIICVKCGNASENCLCDSCKQSVDLETLCCDIINYKPGTGENQIWDNIAAELDNPNDFKNLVFSISADLPTPRKEYMRLLCVAANKPNVPKASRPWLYEVYESLKAHEELTVDERDRIEGLMLGALYMDYRYSEANDIAEMLLNKSSLPWQTSCNLADFFSKTRRYDESSTVIEAARKVYVNDEVAISELNKLKNQNEKYRDAKVNGKKEYMPSPRENKDAVRETYVNFLASIGIEVETGKAKDPTPIPKDQYPTPREIREANFDSFVAFDLETTGRGTTIDSIIEIGAIKVIGGNIVDSAELTFQEFVKPFKAKLKPEVTNLTGITEEDVVNARKMWEVTPDFMNFVGDNILVGFNNVSFDSKFLARAGRYSHLIIENPHFDVMKFAEQFKEQLGFDSKRVSLEALSEKLDIENPSAHRALADAITTAAVYLKLKEMECAGTDVSVDDLLSDLDEW